MNRHQGQDDGTNPTLKRLGKLNISVIEESRPLSVSTRAIGFALSEAIPHLNICTYDDFDDDDDNIRRAPLSEMYRASLAQLEAKVYFARNNQIRPFLNRSAYDPTLHDLQQPLMTRVAKEIKLHLSNTNVSPVSDIINSIGHVEVNNMHYEPVFMSEMSPFNLRISNLRQYCEKMADLNTDAAERIAGYKLNSIPNAVWENANNLQYVRLSNINEIIPANYNNDIELLLNDLEENHLYIHTIPKCKRTKLMKQIDYDGIGDPGMLVSSHVSPEARNRVVTFWSREYLDAVSWRKGAFILVGEVSEPINVSHRSRMLAAQENDICRSRYAFSAMH